MALYHLTLKTACRAKGHCALSHAQYIEREGRYRRLSEDLEHVEHHNMPEFAEDDTKPFWDAADTYERANGRLYTEIEFALPRELSQEDRLKLAQEFAKDTLGDRHPYTLAIHNQKALDGGENAHVHLMFSEREMDGNERPREQFFKRGNHQKPHLGGAKKNRDWSRRDKVEEVREAWEMKCNIALEKAGKEERIDRRSLKDQGIDRAPEPKLGQYATEQMREGLESERGAEVIELRFVRAEEKKVDELEKELRQEQAKLYNLEAERAKRGPKNKLKFNVKDESITDEEKQEYKRTIDLAFTRHKTQKGTEFRWKKRPEKVAFIDKGDTIEVATHNRTSIKAALQLTKEKGWGSPVISGSDEFRQRAWLEAEVLGIKTKGYEPTREDLKLLASRRFEEQKKREKYRKARLKKRGPGVKIHREKVRADELKELLMGEVYVPLEEEHKRLFQRRKELGLEKDPADIYGRTWRYSETSDSALIKKRERIESKFSAVKRAQEETLKFKRDLEYFGEEKVEIRYATGRTSIVNQVPRPAHPAEFQRQVAARKKEFNKTRSRKRGRGLGF
ncbi:MobA/MobL family protein [Oligoflexia bacterium]|nr:MobA/MobL family protein [Oligoflexia bacterium]